MGWQTRWLARFYDRSRGWADGTEEFHALCRRFLPAGGRILEIGAGPDNETSRFLATHGQLHGLDVDPAVRHNPSLVEARILDGERFPYDDATFSGCVSNFVLEHIGDVPQHLREVRRVLEPRCAYVFRTPNRWHYVPFVSSITPHWFHVLVANRLRGHPPGAHDPYPTYYRANTRRVIRRLAAGGRLRVEELRVIEKEPMYGMASRALFLAFMAYERLVNSTERLQDLRATILGAIATESAGLRDRDSTAQRADLAAG